MDKNTSETKLTLMKKFHHWPVLLTNKTTRFNPFHTYILDLCKNCTCQNFWSVFLKSAYQNTQETTLGLLYRKKFIADLCIGYQHRKDNSLGTMHCYFLTTVFKSDRPKVYLCNASFSSSVSLLVCPPVCMSLSLSLCTLRSVLISRCLCL